MFSRRVPSQESTNEFSRSIARRRTASSDFVDLTESNPTRCGFTYDPQILDALARKDSLRYEPHPQGLSSAREAVAGYYREIGRAVDPDNLLLTAGTSEAYSHLFRLLADPGDEILVPAPGYPLLEVLTGLDALRVEQYPLSHGTSGWSIDPERLRNCISTKTRAIAVVSPNNPTGSYLKKEELAAVAGLCSQHRCALLVDEVFSDFASARDESRVVTAVESSEALTFVMNGLSKMVALPQMKLAWIHVNGPRALRAEAMERLAYISDAFLSVSTPVQHAAAALIAGRAAIQRQVQDRLNENGRILESLLAGIAACSVLGREGGWYAIVRLRDDLDDERIALALLEEDDVLTHPGYFYDFANGSHLVLSLLPPRERFRVGVMKLAERLRAL